MRSLTLLVTVLPAVATLSSNVAHADAFRYSFDFIGLADGDGNHYPDFNLTIDTPVQIEDSSFGPLPSPLPTPVGYPVNNFGETNQGTFAFSEEGGSIENNLVYFSSTTFIFQTFPLTTEYLGPGTYFGYTEGNNPFVFAGTGSLTVTDLSTPEPSTFVLLGTGLLGVASVACRRILGA